MSRPTLSGIAPIVSVPAGDTRLCRHCATLVRYHPADFAWRHVALGLDHPPEPLEYSAPESPITEGEQRALWGDR